MCGPPPQPGRWPHCALLRSRRPGGQAPCLQWAPCPPPHACCSFPVAYSDVPSCSSFPPRLVTGLAILPGLVQFRSSDRPCLVWQPPPTCLRRTDSPATQSWHIPGFSWLSRLAFQRQSHGKQKTQWQDAPSSRNWGCQCPFLFLPDTVAMLGWISGSWPMHQHIF